MAAVDLSYLKPLHARDLRDVKWDAGEGGRVITRYDAMSDVMTLKGVEMQRSWAPALANVINSGDPTAAFIQPGSGITGVASPPIGDSLAAFTFNATEAMAWTASLLTPLPQGLPGTSMFRLFCSATITTTATASPTITVTPRIGTANTGTTLGASASISLTASQTSVPVLIYGDLTIRSAGRTSGSAFFTGKIEGKLAAPANGAVDANHIFGFTAAASVDFISAAQALWVGLSSAVTTSTFTPQQLLWITRN